MSSPFNYRPDIDGLRALAVLSVILYHSGLSFLPGGYVGVDVFFVISGFVITSVVQTDLAAGRFTIRGFYERRIRRIFPALFAMIAFCLVIGSFFLMPDDYKRMGQSSVANAVFLSNFYFLKDSGYFGATAAAKPLLHTWSLAVEEQFYLLLPLYLLLLKRLSDSWMRWLTLGIALLSLVLSIVATRYEPQASFFMLPTRAWELMVGVLLAQGTVPAVGSTRDGWLRSLLGIVLIGFALLTYSEKTTFPGIAAIPPVLGTALIISAGDRGGWASQWLASRSMVFVGKISYPLYLWHFPLLGFASYLSLTGLGLIELVTVNLAILIFALVSWRFVEKPVRERRVFLGQRSLFLFGGLCIVATMVAGLVIHLERGLESRFSGEQLKIVRGMTDRVAGAQNPCMNLSPAQIALGELCALGATDRKAVSTDTIVWGDSHGEALAPGLSDVASRADKPLLFAGRHGCPIGTQFQSTDWQRRDCAEFDAAIHHWLLASPEIRRVVLVSRWSSLRDDKSDAAADSLTEVVKQLTAAGKQVWLVGPVPDVKTLVPRALYLKSLGLAQHFELRPREDEFKATQSRTLAVLDELARLSGVTLVLPHELLCSDGWCEVVRNGSPLYFDDNHLTTAGAKLVARVLEPAFR
jgi:peptidoglycan/LPS O-acetylase OafA/YrhL